MSEPSEADVERFDGATDEVLDTASGTAASPIVRAAVSDAFAESVEKQLRDGASLGVSDGDFAAEKRRQEIDRAQARIDVAQAEVSRLTQDNRLRVVFAAWIALMVTVITLGGLEVILIYLWLQRENLEPSVIVAWFSAQVINTIGLAAIVARYLFPESKQHIKKDAEVEHDSPPE